MQTFITIVITVWLTMSLLVIVEELADRNARGFSNLLLVLIFGPVIIISDIIGHWEDENRRWKEFDKRWPKK